MREKYATNADFIVVGAGSAGCVIASRLAEIAEASVVLIEAGRSDKNFRLRMPSAFYMPIGNRRFDWCYEAEPEINLKNRKISCPRGRVMGGSSSINGMVYVRGHPSNYDDWEKLGAENWSYEAVLPYFRKAQAMNGFNGSETQGEFGPLHTTNGRMENPLYQTFLEATEQAGYAQREDLNDDVQEGFGPLPMTVENGIRASTSRCYLNETPSNLTIVKNAQVTRINFDNKRATGVGLLKQGKSMNFVANSEVILCAGAIDTPKLLMLSGIGPGDHLAELNIPVVADLPGVGSNLMDHLEVYLQQACTKPVSLSKFMGPLSKARIGAQWFLNKTGLGSTNHFEVGGFIKSDHSKKAPDIQFHFLPAAMTYDGSLQIKEHGFQVHIGPMQSKSRGCITLRTSNPLDSPRLNFGYMSDPEDWVVFRSAIRQAREIFSQSAFDQFRGEEISPGDWVQSDYELDEFIRARCESAYHPCGTCKMGNDEQSVVDSNGIAHALDGLRVADASIFPKIVNCNLNATVIMAAEKISDEIKKRYS